MLARVPGRTRTQCPRFFEVAGLTRQWKFRRFLAPAIKISILVCVIQRLNQPFSNFQPVKMLFNTLPWARLIPSARAPGTVAAARPQHSPSPTLLGLPSELRQQVLRELLQDSGERHALETSEDVASLEDASAVLAQHNHTHGVIHCHNCHRVSRVRLQPSKLSPAILEVNRQIYGEGIDILRANSMIAIRYAITDEKLRYVAEALGLSGRFLQPGVKQGIQPVMSFTITSSRDLPELRTQCLFALRDLDLVVLLLLHEIIGFGADQSLKFQLHQNYVPGFCHPDTALSKLFVEPILPWLCDLLKVGNTAFPITYSTSLGHRAYEMAILQNDIDRLLIEAQLDDSTIEARNGQSALQICTKQVQDLQVAACTGIWDGPDSWEHVSHSLFHNLGLKRSSLDVHDSLRSVMGLFDACSFHTAVICLNMAYRSPEHNITGMNRGRLAVEAISKIGDVDLPRSHTAFHLLAQQGPMPSFTFWIRTRLILAEAWARINEPKAWEYFNQALNALKPADSTDEWLEDQVYHAYNAKKGFKQIAGDEAQWLTSSNLRAAFFRDYFHLHFEPMIKAQCQDVHDESSSALPNIRKLEQNWNESIPEIREPCICRSCFSCLKTVLTKIEWRRTEV